MRTVGRLSEGGAEGDASTLYQVSTRYWAVEGIEYRYTVETGSRVEVRTECSEACANIGVESR